MEKRIKRLETAVVVLSVLFVLSLGLAGVAATELSAINKKIPDYNELKQDVQSLKTVYNVIEAKTDSLNIKETLTTAYDSTFSKSGQVINYLKKQRENK